MGLRTSRAGIAGVSLRDGWEPVGVRDAFDAGQGSNRASSRRISLRESIQREGRWKSDAYKVYTRKNTEDYYRVSSRLAQRGRKQCWTTRPTCELE